MIEIKIHDREDIQDLFEIWMEISEIVLCMNGQCEHTHEEEE